MFMRILVELEDDSVAATLNKGEQVTVIGTCKGMTLGSITIDEAKIK